MKPYVVLKVGKDDYRLRLSTSAAIDLEEQLSCSVVDGMNRLGEIRVLVKYVFAAAKQLNDSIKTEDDVFDLIDEYTMQGGTIETLYDVMLEVMVCSGYLKQEAIELSKKLTAQLQEKQAKLLS